VDYDGSAIGVRRHSLAATIEIVAVTINNPPAIIHSADPLC
jgi:hypothetical protein